MSTSHQHVGHWMVLPTYLRRIPAARILTAKISYVNFFITNQVCFHTVFYQITRTDIIQMYLSQVTLRYHKKYQHDTNRFNFRQWIHTDNCFWFVVNKQAQEVPGVLWWRIMRHNKGVVLLVRLWNDIKLVSLHFFFCHRCLQ